MTEISRLLFSYDVLLSFCPFPECPGTALVVILIIMDVPARRRERMSGQDVELTNHGKYIKQHLFIFIF